jgi:hypothetical protein
MQKKFLVRPESVAAVVVVNDSPYSAPIVIVKKDHGTNRFSIDHRALNRVTLFDPELIIPCIEGIFTRLSGKKFFSKFDLTNGYWQVPLLEKASIMSAITVPDAGHYRLTVSYAICTCQCPNYIHSAYEDCLEGEGGYGQLQR